MRADEIDDLPRRAGGGDRDAAARLDLLDATALLEREHPQYVEPQLREQS